MALVILTRNICQPWLALYSSDWSRHSQILVALCFHQRCGGSISQLWLHCSCAQSNGDCHPDYRSYWYVFPPLSDLMVIGWREYWRTHITTQSTASSPLNAFKISFAHSSMLWWWYVRCIESVESGWVNHTGHCRFNVLGWVIGNSVERRLSFSKHKAWELMRYVNWCADVPYSKRRSHRPFLNVPQYHSAWVMWGPLGFLGECPNSQGDMKQIKFIPPSFLVSSSPSVILKELMTLLTPGSFFSLSLFFLCLNLFVYRPLWSQWRVSKPALPTSQGLLSALFLLSVAGILLHSPCLFFHLAPSCRYLSSFIPNSTQEKKMG